MTKPPLLWHSNAPFVQTGYGQQTNLFTSLLAESYDLTISCFYGLEGAPMHRKGIMLLPGLGGEYGNDTILQHATRLFGGDPRAGTVVTLMDVWVLNPAVFRELNVACWTPVDHEPAPPQVIEFLMASEAVPVAMSRFGQRMLGRLDPLYVPHAVDTEVFCRRDKQEARAGAFPDDAFVVGMVAANKGRPSRKGFAQALQAFAKFAEKHENAHLYLHTTLDPNVSAGENIPAMLKQLQIPQERLRFADQYCLLHAPHSTREMAQIYGALDVLLNPAWGEGFGIPVLEAQACGVPGIVTDFSAMPEVCGAGWKVKYQRHWTNLKSWQAIPDVEDIASALEDCYALTAGKREKLSKQARRHALEYDVRKVFGEYMLPALKISEARFASRKPVSVPSRLKAVA